MLCGTTAQEQHVLKGTRLFHRPSVRSTKLLLVTIVSFSFRPADLLRDFRDVAVLSLGCGPDLAGPADFGRGDPCGARRPTVRGLFAAPSANRLSPGGLSLESKACAAHDHCTGSGRIPGHEDLDRRFARVAQSDRS